MKNDTPNSNTSGGPNPPQENVYEILDISRLRLSQDFQSQLGVKKLLVSVPVRRPDRQWWIRVHPGDEWVIDAAILEDSETRENFVVDRDLLPEPEISNEVTPKRIYVCITRQSNVFLWPVRLPGPGGRLDSWNTSAHEAAALARTSWVRVSANMGLGAYVLFQASAEYAEPAWPDADLQQLLDLGFKGRYIRTFDHPMLKKLRGEIS